MLALADAGATEIGVLNRTADRAGAAAALAGSAGTVLADDDVGRFDLVVNATSVGMAGTSAAGELPIDPVSLHPQQVVADLVYQPLETPLLRAARERGAVALDGVGMLVHQAALQFEQFTELPAPLPQMRQAGEAALRGRLDEGT